MNPYKKIERLEKQIEQLKLDNKEYKYALMDLSEKQKLAEDKYIEYCKMIDDVKKIKESYSKLIHQLKLAINQQPKTYKAFDKELKRAIK